VPNGLKRGEIAAADRPSVPCLGWADSLSCGRLCSVVDSGAESLAEPLEDDVVDTPMSNLHFRAMSLTMKLRDLLSPRKDVLAEVGIAPGSRVLDYGCGPGGYVAHASELVGESGKIYALDIHPLAVQSVQRMASKMGLTNVETICSDCKTGLPDNSIDVALLYDTFHGLGEPGAVLAELHRVLKPGGILSFNDHHMKEDEIISALSGTNLFKLSGKGKSTYTFLREQGQSPAP
jgi:ubiquinone/menaquinone biosynthesis C-methylase UbiE